MKEFIIEDLRKKKGLSQQELADAIGVSKVQICRWENIQLGDSTLIRNSNKKKLADFFDCSVNDLYNINRTNWIDTAKQDGKNCASSTISVAALNKYKNLILDSLKVGNRDRVTELLIQLSFECSVEFQFYYRYLAIKNLDESKEIVYAFLAAAVKEENNND